MTDSERNVVLSGFMGTGKTTIGKKVAQELGRPFVDTDDLIQQTAGKSISDIFAEDGEPAFRQIETRMLAEANQTPHAVIATGGGALVSQQNRDLLVGNLVICLDASPEAIAERLGEDITRPLLRERDAPHHIQTLLAKRRSAYSRIPWHIDTSRRSVEQVVSQVLALLESQPDSYGVSSPAGAYDVLIADHAITWLADLLSAHSQAGRVMVVSDENVWHHHGAAIEQTLSGLHAPWGKIILPPGEQHKNLDTLAGLYEGFVKAGLDRSSTVVAIGGGVITDMAGFAASSYMRGIELFQVPTTLLGMVDASVGGKVAVDLRSGKNLVGAFVAPRLVLIDPTFVSTLDAEQIQCGMAEIIKAGVIDDPELFGRLEQSNPPLRWTIDRALQVKIRIVKEDPLEHGRRMVLNLGHTFGHAFELLSNYTLPHGMAVGMGTATAAHAAEIMGLCSRDTRQRIENTLLRHGLATQWQAPNIDAILDAMRSDKKSQQGTMRVVLPHSIGEVAVHSITDTAPIRQALERSKA